VRWQRAGDRRMLELHRQPPDPARVERGRQVLRRLQLAQRPLDRDLPGAVSWPLAAERGGDLGRQLVEVVVDPGGETKIPHAGEGASPAAVHDGMDRCREEMPPCRRHPHPRPGPRR
jgi:hypothetical protein